MYTESKCEEGKKAEDGIYKDYTCAAVYDVTDPANPREAGVISQSGQYHTMRVKDGYVYLVSDFYTYYDSSVSNESDYIPQIQGSLLRAEDIYMPQERPEVSTRLFLHLRFPTRLRNYRQRRFSETRECVM